LLNAGYLRVGGGALWGSGTAIVLLEGTLPLLPSKTGRSIFLSLSLHPLLHNARLHPDFQRLPHAIMQHFWGWRWWLGKSQSRDLVVPKYAVWPWANHLSHGCTSVSSPVKWGC
jgi:hypothetical protein